MLRDGIYEFFYSADTDCGLDRGLIIIRGGRILGSDPCGGVYKGKAPQRRDVAVNQPHGSHRATSAPSQLLRVAFDYIVPPGGELVTGRTCTAPEGCTVAIEAEVDATAVRQTVRTAIDGVELMIDLCYLGPLPE